VNRASLDCQLDGRTFARVVTDIVVGGAELGHVERLRLPGTLAFAGLGPVDVLAIGLNQHFAEKLHAMVRRYGDRPSTRVKDLADLMLFIESGLRPTPELAKTVSDVFALRQTPLPDEIQVPSVSWEARYDELARELRLVEPTLAGALGLLGAFWSHTRQFMQET
jgi:hypothetical protein